MRKASSLGSDAVLKFSEGQVETLIGNVKELTGGIGASMVIIATSSPASLDLATKIAAKNSKINIFAGMPEGYMISLDPNWLRYNQISIGGSFSATPLMLEEAVKLAADRQFIDLSEIVTHRYGLDDIGKALLVTERYTGLRAVINQF